MISNFNTSDRNAQKGGDFVPRLAMINDIAGFGRCSTTVSLPVISVMKVQVCPVPTSVLSNHLGFPLCHFDDYTSHMRDYIKVWGEHEKSAIWFKNGDGNWTTSCRRYFNMS